MSSTTTLADAHLEELDARLRGPLILPSDERYDDARAIYNGMIDKRPGALVGAHDVADVMATVDFCREHEVLLAIRGGGHNGPGLGTCEGGLVLDLSRMRGVRVHPDRKVADVQGGCTWGDVDHATHAFGLATPSGIISTTGVGGLTLGGGHGYLTRKYGLTADNLVSADVVLADGRMVTADEDRHPDLFWAIRGGGGNFGVVTNFRLRLHPVDAVVAGPTMWPIDRAAELVRWYDDFMARAGRDVYGFFMTMVVPPAPAYPEAYHGAKVCGILWCHLGSEEDARRDIFDPLGEFGEPAVSHVEPMPYPALQSAFDDLYPQGLHWYWKGHYVKELTDASAEIIQAYGERLPTDLSTMHLYPVDGAPTEVAPDAMAYRQRDARWSQVFAGVARDPEDIGTIRSWAREHWQALTPHVGETGYINFLMADDDEVVRATHGGNYERLMEVKAEYDPTNLFRVNQNIPVAS